MLEAGVLQKFGELQQVVGAVVHQDHQGAHLLSIQCVENIIVEKKDKSPHIELLKELI